VAAAPPWQAFVGWAIERYGASLDVLELCNEPNLQGTAPETVAAMFVTAQRIARRPRQPRRARRPRRPPDIRGYDRFTDRLLDALDARGFVAGPRFAWTHHNYADVAYATSRTADVRRRSSGAGPAGRRATRRPADPRDRGRRDAAHHRPAPGHRRPGGPSAPSRASC
jgi:hypothetical protein